MDGIGRMEVGIAGGIEEGVARGEIQAGTRT